MISLDESSIWLCKWGDTCYPYSIYWILLLFCIGLIIGMGLMALFIKYKELQFAKHKSSAESGRSG